jgi:hypothetical protein
MGKVRDEYFSLQENGNTVILYAGRQRLELPKECVLKIRTAKHPTRISMDAICRLDAARNCVQAG